MKTQKKTSLILITIFILAFNADLISQPPPSPPPQHGGGNNVPNNGGGAPLGSGTLILIALGMAYGGRRMYGRLKEELEE